MCRTKTLVAQILDKKKDRERKKCKDKYRNAL